MGRGETNAKKRKRNSEAKATLNGHSTSEHVDTSKPTALFKPIKGRDWTVSVALPGSIIANAQSHDLRTALVGQIARALSVFCVDEVVVFSDSPSAASSKAHAEEEYTGTSDPDHFLVHLLSYLETPPHLRKLLFPLHQNLRTAGTLPSLDLPHHLRGEEWCLFREGVTVEGERGDGLTRVEVGLKTPVAVEADIPASTRVTVRFDETAEVATRECKKKEIVAEAVSPDEPREQLGYYWGYGVRRAGSLSAVFEECGYEGGYDLSIGTSERGVDLECLYSKDSSSQDDAVTGKFNHLLVVFGGVAGLEVAVKNDAALQKLGVYEAKDVFDRWVNVCPGQGSRTIRTEEALWIGLTGLRRLVYAQED